MRQVFTLPPPSRQTANLGIMVPSASVCAAMIRMYGISSRAIVRRVISVCTLHPCPIVCDESNSDSSLDTTNGTEIASKSVTYKKHFDKADAKCHDCGNVTVYSICLFALVLLLASGTVVFRALLKLPKRRRERACFLELFAKARGIWRVQRPDSI